MVGVGVVEQAGKKHQNVLQQVGSWTEDKLNAVETKAGYGL